MRRVPAVSILVLGALLAIPPAQAQLRAQAIEFLDVRNGGTHTTGDLQNGDFSSGRLAPWELRPQVPITKNLKGAPPPATSAEVNSEEQLVVKFGAEGGGRSTQILQKDLHLEGDTTYVLRFDAKSSFGGNVRVRVMQHVEPFENYGVAINVNVKRLWNTFEIVFTTPPGDKFDGRLSFYFPGLARPFEEYCFDNVSLEKLEECGDGTVTGDESCDSGAGPVVDDGGFDAGTPNASWDEFSSNFGTPLCTEATCGFDLTHAGDWWLWFGGTSSLEEGSVSQSISLPQASTATLNFWLWAITCSEETSDTFAVTVDGSPIFMFDLTDERCAASGYEQVTLDLSPFIGTTFELAFQAITGTTGVGGNIFLDTVSIDVDGCRADCTFCGDGTANGYETCDDGNSNDGDGCTFECVSDDVPALETREFSREELRR